MHRLRNGSRSRRSLIALTAAAAAFGVATAIQVWPTGARAAPGPGSALAWAIVQSNGTITHESNVTSVSHPATGVYCVHLNHIDPATVAAVATATGVVGTFEAMNTDPGACGVGGRSVLVSSWNTQTTTLTDTGFSIVMP